MQITQGGCLCSAIRFRISGNPFFQHLSLRDLPQSERAPDGRVVDSTAAD
jgi:hypothetical protein